MLPSMGQVSRAFVLLAAGFLAASALAQDKEKPQKGPIKWEPIGLSGGGAMFAPALSSLDAKLMMINCDMSAAYVSQDGGASWRMIHHAQLRASTRCRPAFHPADAKTIVAANGDAGLSVSKDKGEHWTPLGKLPGPARGEVALDAAHAERIFVGLDDGVARSQDGGATWSRSEGPRGLALSFHFSPRAVFAATRKGIWRSEDGGETWTLRVAGLPDGEINSFAGGSNQKSKTTLLYAAVPSVVKDGALGGGLYVSKDKGDSWQSAMGDGLNKETKPFDDWAASKVVQYEHVATSDARPTTVYAFNKGTGIPPPHHCSVFRSDDAGKTWAPTFQGDPRFPGITVERDYTVASVKQFYQACPNGVGASASNPDVLLCVDEGRAWTTTDGGKSWRASHTKPAPGSGPDDKEARWLCNGLVVTTTWNYYVDPHDPLRHLICYTDVGFARSHDKGKTWSWWALAGRSPWGNTCYELAFDPQVPGRVWGAFSDTHDIPNGNIIWGNHNAKHPGGVCGSADSGATWAKSNAGLPAAPVVSIALDPKSKPGTRTLYAAVFSHGVYRSTDDGATWALRSDGVGSEENKRVVRVSLHADGTLFALVTALRKDGKFVADGTGLYRSKDQGGRWEQLTTAPAFYWPKDFTVDPKDSKVIYLGAADGNGEQQGGLWRTTDGGATWKKLARKGPEHFGAYLHPKKKGWIYMTLTEGAPGSGLWLSKDDGETWSSMDGIPFSNVQRIAFDPADEKVIYATTFGGSVWRGPSSE